MKFDPRQGSTARTLATSAAGWWQSTAAEPAGAATAERPPRPSRLANGGSNGPARPTRTATASFNKGQQILGPGDGVGLVYIVRSGYVRLYKSLTDGRAINVGLLGPNTVFAQEERQDGIASGIAAEALADTTLAIVPADDLATMIAESPELATGVVHGMTRRLTELQTLIEQILARDASVRLLSTLTALARGFGRPTTDGMTAIALSLTHQSLANMIGSNRVTVTRKLLELQEQGVVRSLGRNEIAIDVERARHYIRLMPQMR
jgi:CRP/FNR family transcriptional regulator